MGKTFVKQAKRISESPLARLKRTGSLNVYELTSADEILAAWQMTAGLPVARDDDLGMPASEPRPGAADSVAAKRSDVLTKYRQWRDDMRGHVGLGIVLDVLVHEVAPTVLDAGNRWRKGTARGHLVVALRHFAALRGNTPSGGRNWKMDTQNAELEQAVERAKIEL